MNKCWETSHKHVSIMHFHEWMLLIYTENREIQKDKIKMSQPMIAASTIKLDKKHHNIYILQK